MDFRFARMSVMLGVQRRQKGLSEATRGQESSHQLLPFYFD